MIIVIPRHEIRDLEIILKELPEPTAVTVSVCNLNCQDIIRQLEMAYPPHLFEYLPFESEITISLRNPSKKAIFDCYDGEHTRLKSAVWLEKNGNADAKLTLTPTSLGLVYCGSEPKYLQGLLNAVANTEIGFFITQEVNL